MLSKETSKQDIEEMQRIQNELNRFYKIFSDASDETTKKETLKSVVEYAENIIENGRIDQEMYLLHDMFEFKEGIIEYLDGKTFEYDFGVENEREIENLNAEIMIIQTDIKADTIFAELAVLGEKYPISSELKKVLEIVCEHENDALNAYISFVEA